MGGYVSPRVQSTVLPAALLIAAVLVVYGPTLHYPFVYEDLNDINAFTGEWPLSEKVAIMVARPTRALTFVTFEINKALFGAGNPVGFHAGSVLLHVLCVLLVGAVARLVWSPPAVLLAMGVFALHPLQVEAVAYVSSRAELLAACGVLLALRATSAGSFAGAWLGVVVATLGKETAIVAWGLVPLWATWTQASFPTRRWLLMGAPAVLVGALVAWRLSVPVALDGAQLAETSTSIWRMVGLFWVPVGLTIDHDWQGVPLWLQAWALGASLGLTAWAATLGLGRSWLAMAWLWTVVALAPRFIVPVTEGLHEHHFYVPMIGWCLCAGGWLHEQAQNITEGTQ